MQIKTVYSKAPQDGLLEMNVASRLTSPVGVNGKSGNSYTMTHQTVWPGLEYCYPYLSDLQFDSLHLPQANVFNEVYAQEAVISKYLTAAGPNFDLSYLLPVPDFFTTTEPVTEAEFQSLIPRMSAPVTNCGVLTVNAGDTGISVVFATPISGLASRFIDLYVVCYRISGTTDDTFMVSVSPNSGTTSPITALSASSGALASVPIRWSDTTNNGKSTYSARAEGVTGLDVTQLAISVQVVGQTNSGSQYVFVWRAKISPFSALACLSSFYRQTDTIGHVGVDNLVNVALDTTEPLDVNITSSQVTLGVDIENQPIEVNVQGFPTDVGVRVQGVIAPDTPIWNSTYYT